MALIHNTNSIITNGLVLALDAANPKSYPGSGTTWSDLSGLGNNGTLVAGVGYTGSNGGSLTFNGSSQYASVAPNSVFRFGTSDFTINTWAYFNSLPSGGYVLFENLILGGFGARNDAFVLILMASGKLDVFSVEAFIGSSAIGLVANTWYNITLTRTSGVWRYYINNLLDTNTFTLSVNLTSGGCIIGRLGDASDYYLNGRISNTQIYNRALTASEISQNYNALKSRYLM